MKYLILTMLFILAIGCAPLNVEVDNVHVVHSVDVSNLTEYFDAMCVAEHPAYNSSQIEECSDVKVAEFLSTFGGGS
jgi:hypothetical protein